MMDKFAPRSCGRFRPPSSNASVKLVFLLFFLEEGYDGFEPPGIQSSWVKYSPEKQRGFHTLPPSKRSKNGLGRVRIFHTILSRKPHSRAQETDPKSKKTHTHQTFPVVHRLQRFTLCMCRPIFPNKNSFRKPVVLVYGRALAASVAVQCHVVTPYQLYFTYRAAFEHGQVELPLLFISQIHNLIYACLWRLVTNFLYFGPLSLDFFFHLFFLTVVAKALKHGSWSLCSMRYSKMLEENTYHGHRADYAWLLIVCCTLLLLLSPLSPAPFLSAPLSFTLVYLWARLNSNVRLSLFGVIAISAGHLPYALVLFSWALSSGYHGVIGDLLGIAVGHFWSVFFPSNLVLSIHISLWIFFSLTHPLSEPPDRYFFTEIWKRELGSGERNWLKTPDILVRLIDGPEALTQDEDDQE
ncbi:uncharacterized protein VP01_2113g3 [Puccinia sorghi]|uniref:Derlin n=1 Tax=Puccinia sorghi TaxID=27349 RepID=A0A0L6VBV8_9BASI|nr:uncharacterized protein VP01_2113g3 [Puccinia sorghi]